MNKIYRISICGSGLSDFTKGTIHPDFGEVIDIIETPEILTYGGDSCASSYNCVVKVIFKDQEIVFQANNPYMVVYREKE